MAENDNIHNSDLQFEEKKATEMIKGKIKVIDKTTNSNTNPLENNNNPVVEQAPPPQQPAPARGNLSIFKLVFYYWIINQIIGFFFKGNQKGAQNSNLFSNVFLDNEPFVF